MIDHNPQFHNSRNSKRYSTTNLLLSPILTTSPNVTAPSSARSSTATLGLGIGYGSHSTQDRKSSSASLYRIERSDPQLSSSSPRHTSLRPSIDSPLSSKSLSNPNIPTNNLKILLVGDTDVGKTSMILSYCHELSSHSPSTSSFKLNRPSSQLQKRTTSINNNYDDRKQTMPIQYSKFENNEKLSSHNTIHTDNMIKLKKTVLTNTKFQERKTKNLKRFSLNDFDDMLLKRKSLLLNKNMDSTSMDVNDNNDNYTSYDYVDMKQKDNDGKKDASNKQNEIIINTRPTIGIDIKTTLINIGGDKRFNCIFWDPAGQERFKNVMMNSLYRVSDGIILSYDICNLQSFQNCCQVWLKDVLDNLRFKDLSRVKFYLVGNKVDMYKERQVNHEDVLNMITNMEYDYGLAISGNFEVSCKWENNVERTFNLILMDLIESGCYEHSYYPLGVEAAKGASSPDSNSGSTFCEENRHKPSFEEESPRSTVRNRFIKRMSREDLDPYNELGTFNSTIVDMNATFVEESSRTSSQSDKSGNFSNKQNSSKKLQQKKKELSKRSSKPATKGKVIDITKPLGSEQERQSSSSPCCY
ncbi:Rab family GTPase YPT11 NDAI_0A06180 [Naumovozyma dairenensis CBS 421]|uniref:GTP-binding protein YPT11 n=1 Tax=Naumovozyma dairenensis (strain ATCC 10597 / BCRC 20456 / CBS 421 / NBRC 0211 / NRRL Y-12639) TaxID=1071378 RepID=G0W4N5_NAUDC|nr:hypothetical protein NDAI_0A06180 [Naumovozyma dairenensis CBS 421]CCD22773.1 hypothetical protein NDAI_0A06180 [Naumovozyma dairenensis CBS 421]